MNDIRVNTQYSCKNLFGSMRRVCHFGLTICETMESIYDISHQI